ncbi:uncharacterized protein TNIN_344171 [Trichonephila inaurata madagascariensis]|uniref:Uncharacterized protein n=1 Tax=Trichonephila inaurata madagascariensis TaxID=2747483 RepID=A0A8X6Y6C0_9ARAC|nr:uncharacterized protein TNIN_344171 [Trichonephila inaurata madagascariensis]
MSKWKIYISILLNKEILGKVNFVPKLEHIILARLAVKMYSDPEIIKFEMDEKYGPFHETSNEIWEPFVREKISKSGLPEIILDKVIGLMKPLSYEHLTWKSSHAFLFILRRSFQAVQYFSWTAEGTIDWFETAKRLVHCKDLNFFQRFVLACTYSLKDDVLKLWRRASSAERRKVVKPTRQTYEYYFMSCKEQVFKKWFDWLKLSTGPCPSVYNLFEFFPQIPFQRHFLLESSPEVMVEYLADRSPFCDSEGDLSFLVLSEISPMKMYYRWAPFHTLLLFLDWPLQTQFMEVADHLCALMQADDFLKVLRCLCDKIENNWSDVDYAQILREFWKNGSSDYKKHCEKDSSFPMTKGSQERTCEKLKNVNLPKNAKHPIITLKCHCITELIMRHNHHRYLHGRLELILSALTMQFRSINARKVVRKILRKCVIYLKHESASSQQIRRCLPVSRMNPGRATLLDSFAQEWKSIEYVCLRFCVFPYQSNPSGIGDTNFNHQILCVCVCFLNVSSYVE